MQLWDRGQSIPRSRISNEFRVNEASMQPRSEHVPRPVLSDRTPRSRWLSFLIWLESKVRSFRSPVDSMSSGFSTQQAPPPYSASPSHSVNGGGPLPPKAAPAQPSKPSAKALFDFTAENEGELELKEGQVLDEFKREIQLPWYDDKLEISCRAVSRSDWIGKASRSLQVASSSYQSLSL